MRTKTATAVVLAVLTTAAVPSLAETKDPVAKFETNYDRGDGVQNTSRPARWEVSALVGKSIDSGAINGLTAEVGQTQFGGGAATGTATELKTLPERIAEEPEYLEVFERVHGIGTALADTDYGHEGDLSDLEGRAGTIADNLRD